MRVVVVRAQALSILVFEEEQPLIVMGIDVINVACSHGSTLNCTLTAERLPRRACAFGSTSKLVICTTNARAGPLCACGAPMDQDQLLMQRCGAA